MKKTPEINNNNFDHFIQVLSRVLGVPRKRLEKMMLQGLEPPRSRQGSIVRRDEISSQVSD